MPLRSSVSIIFVLLLLVAGPARAVSFVDAAERYVVVPDRAGRVMTVNPPADVLVFVLAPEKLVGWSAARRRLNIDTRIRLSLVGLGLKHVYRSVNGYIQTRQM